MKCKHNLFYQQGIKSEAKNYITQIIIISKCLKESKINTKFIKCLSIDNISAKVEIF